MTKCNQPIPGDVIEMIESLPLAFLPIPLLVKAASEVFDVRECDILGAARNAEVVSARHAVTVLAVIRRGISRVVVGRHMGLNHSTISYGVSKSGCRMANDDEYRNNVIDVWMRAMQMAPPATVVHAKSAKRPVASREQPRKFSVRNVGLPMLDRSKPTDGSWSPMRLEQMNTAFAVQFVSTARGQTYDSRVDVAAAA